MTIHSNGSAVAPVFIDNPPNDPRISSVTAATRLTPAAYPEPKPLKMGVASANR